MLPNVTDHDQVHERLLEAAETVRASGVLGRSRLLIGLFDFLVARAADGRPPKESEIAYAVFDKSGEFETGQDAVVRVYVHRLRRKLEEFAPEADRLAGRHLILPKGEYRIVCEAAGSPLALIEDTAPPALPAPSPVRIRPRWIAAAVALLVAVNLGGWALLGHRDDPPAKAVRSPIWAPFVNSRFPLLFVVGDYYIFGDSDDGMEVARLVREYDVSSPSQLNQFLMDHPDKAGRYVDLGLSYLPTSSAEAVADLAPLFAGRRPSRVLTVSQLTPELLKTYDVIYIGYISGLGVLHDPVFSGSRFQMGESFDEIIDTVSKRQYVSQAALGPSRGDVYRDYGYAAVFPGPAGNHIAIVAGSRDIGAIAAAEQMSDADNLRSLAKAVGRSDAFEALYEVRGQGEVNFQSRLITAGQRKTSQGWQPAN